MGAGKGEGGDVEEREVKLITESFTIQYPAELGTVQFYLMNTAGEVVMTTQLQQSNTTLSRNNLASGTYLYIIESAGQTRQTGSLMIN